MGQGAPLQVSASCVWIVCGGSPGHILENPIHHTNVDVGNGRGVHGGRLGILVFGVGGEEGPLNIFECSACFISAIDQGVLFLLSTVR
jgi:hypothetical protein